MALRQSLPRVLAEVTASVQTLTSRSSVRLMAACCRTTEAPPRRGSRRGRISERPQRPGLGAVPLQSRSNASPFWIMLLLSFGIAEHGMIDEWQRRTEQQTTNLGVRGSNPFGRANDAADLIFIFESAGWCCFHTA